MKKILYLLPLLLIILACGAQPASTQDVSNRVNATLTALAQNNLQVVAPQATFTPGSIQVVVPGASDGGANGDQKPSVKIQQIGTQQGAQACTTNAQYIISAKITGVANAQVSYTISSDNNGTVFAPDAAGTTIMFDNTGGYDVNFGIRSPFSDPGNVKITITVFVNSQAVNYAYDFICQGGEYKQ